VRKFFLFILLLSLAGAGAWISGRKNIFSGRGEDPWIGFVRNVPKRITLVDDGMRFEVSTSAEDVAAFLREQEAVLGEHDILLPRMDAPLFEGSTVRIVRARSMVLKNDRGEESLFWTLQRTVGDALAGYGVSLGENDFTVPSPESVIRDGERVSLIRVEVEEAVVDKLIPFAKTVKEDSKLSWRKQRLEQKGEAGIQRLTYRVWFHNGKEVERKLVAQERAKDPVTEVTVQGTYVEVGRVHTGAGTWYAHTGTLAAASPWLPMGSHVRVTNQENGRQVIVKINDRGPFGKGRILDLDKAAFAKIASLGEGVIPLKVEEITN
jgi:rare lipoprotein A